MLTWETKSIPYSLFLENFSFHVKFDQKLIELINIVIVKDLTPDSVAKL
jgi:hypothetical protein